MKTAKRFETKQQALDFAEINCPDFTPVYESGKYAAITGLKKGYYLMHGSNSKMLWVETK